jgi:peptidoglycan hydrolase-like protein with peptidoglycan-binding domain
VTAVHTPDTEPAVRRIIERAGLTSGGAPAVVAAPARSRTMAVGPQPGSFLGTGFDACAAPAQSTMDKWLASSPYRAIGVYLSGGLRACAQPNLTSSWVSTQAGKGWHLIPLDVGRQAPCSGYTTTISGTPATARSQGGDAATAAVTAAQALGIPAGSAIYSDIEGYGSGASCTAAVLSYLSGWTEALHALDYLSGVYSSGASGIHDAANAYTDPGYTRVDHIWFAWWNHAADTDSGSYAPASAWAGHQRIHQYDNVSETWGGSTLNIDRNYLDVGEGTVQPPPACAAVTLDFAAYPPLAGGARGAEVTAAQCLLDQAATPSGVFDEPTGTATSAFQRAHELPVTGAVDSHTWTALLASGDTPTLRTGSTGAAVSRLQRALTAALARPIDPDGRFGNKTDQAVRDYQSSRALRADGAVGTATWTALQAGR